MGNTASTTSRKHLKGPAPRKTKRNKKSSASTSNTMRGIRAKMAPAATKKTSRKRSKKPTKANNTSSMIKKYGPAVWTKTKALGVGPFESKQRPPPRKRNIFSKLATNKRRR